MMLFDPAGGLPAALALRLGIIVLTLFVSRRTTRVRRVAFVGSAIASAVTGMTAIHVLRTGVALSGVVFVHQASGFSLGYSVDALSAWFLLVLSILAAPIAVFSLGYV